MPKETIAFLQEEMNVLIELANFILRKHQDLFQKQFFGKSTWEAAIPAGISKWLVAGG